MIFKREEAYRYVFAKPVPCVFTIIRAGSEDVTLNPGEGELVDISPGGCQMAASLDIPVEQEVSVQVNFTLNDEEIRVEGQLVWKKPFGLGFQYGVEFSQDEDLAELITDELKKMVKRE
ncbi:PilZ domain-containing protein [Rossellomorea aquimaris]|uniref:PilZ domain-containing protein n=1 Tax=Rossellomorea TaxID=2837508 RepID=UPI0016538AAA|nr:PilZ domain-containing protein [Rossellomorea vietnamensis]